MTLRKKCLRRTVTIVLGAAVFLCRPTVGQVVVAVIDGARFSETLGAQDTLVTRTWNTFRPAGTMFMNFRNEGVTSTVPGHSSIETGTWQVLANDGSQRPTMPTFFEYFRKQTGAPDSTCAVFTAKAKLNVLTASSHPDYGNTYGATFTLASDDAGVCDSAWSRLRAGGVRLMMINLPQTDFAAHDGDWMGYRTALHRADSLVGALWDSIGTVPLLRDSVTLFILNDHGRHDDAHGGFQHHGDNCEGCRHLMLVMVGRKVAVGRIVTDTLTQRDIAPTVGALMGFSTPLAEGRDMLSMGVLGVRDPVGSPVDFGLEQNFPNPFNPGTGIRFQVPPSSGVEGSGYSSVDLRVFDTLGREVARLVNGPTRAGTHTITWEPSGLASGVYYCRLSVGARTHTRKLVLLR